MLCTQIYQRIVFYSLTLFFIKSTRIIATITFLEIFRFSKKTPKLKISYKAFRNTSNTTHNKTLRFTSFISILVGISVKLTTPLLQTLYIFLSPVKFPITSNIKTTTYSPMFRKSTTIKWFRRTRFAILFTLTKKTSKLRQIYTAASTIKFSYIKLILSFLRFGFFRFSTLASSVIQISTTITRFWKSSIFTWIIPFTMIISSIII